MSLFVIMDALEQVELDAASAIKAQTDVYVRVYPWRPRGQVQLPCIYNWMEDSPAEVKDQTRVRDNMEIRPRIAIRYTDVEEEMRRISLYAQLFIETFDPIMVRPTYQGVRPLGGTAWRFTRTSMRPRVDQLNDIPVLEMEFPTRVEVDRRIFPA